MLGEETRGEEDGREKKDVEYNGMFEATAKKGWTIETKHIAIKLKKQNRIEKSPLNEDPELFLLEKRDHNLKFDSLTLFGY